MRKYNNTKREYDGHKFDSLKELARYKILSAWLASGIIRELNLQEPFVLVPAVILIKDGKPKKKPAVKYIADFTYMKDSDFIVEDVKSEATKNLPVYRLKIHLMKHIHGLDVTEI